MKAILSIVVVLVYSGLIFADDSEFSVLVPGYGNPFDSNLWKQFVDTAQLDRNYGMAIILNPNNGPGKLRDLNYLNDRNMGPLADLVATDAQVLGYVFTLIPGSATGKLRPIDDVKADIDGYLVDTDLYAGFVDGIFIDLVSSQLDNVGYYQELRNHVHLRLPGAPIVGNPGQPELIPAVNTTFTEADFVAAFDTIITFENFGDIYLNNFMSAPHLDGLPIEKIAHLVHSQAVWSAEFLELPFERGAGVIYVTNESCDDPFCNGDNPYQFLSSYWGQFTADVTDFNARTGFFALGNLNGDSVVNLLDVAPFVAQLTSGQFRLQADVNCDGTVNLLDVAPFIQILAGS